MFRGTFFASGQSLPCLFHLGRASRPPFGDVLSIVVDNMGESRLEHLFGGNREKPRAVLTCSARREHTVSHTDAGQAHAACAAEPATSGHAGTAHSATGTARASAALGKGRRRREGRDKGDGESHSFRAFDPGTSNLLTNSQHGSDSFCKGTGPQSQDWFDL
jgi:hypothetical protein